MRKTYAELLNNTQVKRWFENIARGSIATAEVYLRRLGNFCENYKISPQEMLKLNQEQLYTLLLDVVSDLERKGKAGSYIASVIKAIKSWLSFNGIEIKRKIKIKGAQDTPRLREERVPTQEELKKIFLAADLKSKVCCVLVAHAGLRIECLGNYKGEDGLRIKDFPELKIDEKEGKVEFEKIPTLIRIRRELSKAGHQYFTFLSQEGCEYLKEYLESRMRKGEKLTKESPIIVPKVGDKKFITSTNVGDAIRKAIRKAGFPWRPYVLRSYFDTQMMLAESKGLVLRDYRQYWMGHKGDIEHTYTLNKGKLPPNLIEEMRESYKKAQKYLQTISFEESKEDIEKLFKKQLLLVAGFRPEEIKEEDLELSDEEFQKKIRERLLMEMKNNGAKQKVIRLNEVEKYLQEGWEFISVLPRNKAIVKLPEA
jgi:integrase